MKNEKEIADKTELSDTIEPIETSQDTERFSNKYIVERNIKSGGGDSFPHEEHTDVAQQKSCNIIEIRKTDTNVDLFPPKEQIVNNKNNKIKENCRSVLESNLHLLNKSSGANNSRINNHCRVDCEKLDNERNSFVSDEEEGEICDSDDDKEVEIQNLMVPKQNVEMDLMVMKSGVVESTVKPVKNKVLVESLHPPENPIERNTVADTFQKCPKLPSKKCLKMRHKQSEVNYVKQLLNNFQLQIISKNDVILMLRKKSNLNSIQSLSTALISTIQQCEETLLPKILKNLESDHSCLCVLDAGKCIKCDNVKCLCLECPKCKKLNSTYNSNHKESLHVARPRDVFIKCHPHAECIAHPVITTFEKEVLTILVYILKMRNFPQAVNILLDDIHAKIQSSENMLMCERLALWYISI